MLTTAAVWSLVEEGALSFSDKVADHIPEFAAHGKGEVTLFEVTTHQAGFPSGDVSRESWADHARMRAEVCDFKPEWPAGTRLHYHARAAHLTLAMVIEAVTGRDYRDVIRERVIAPLGVGDELYVGVPDSVQQQGLTIKKKSPNILLLVNFFSPDGRYDDLYLSNYATIYVKDELFRLEGVGDIVEGVKMRRHLRRVTQPDAGADVGRQHGQHILFGKAR